MNDMRYVIIGNSTAGIGTVEGIRKLDKDSEILIISDEIYFTYSRPLISYLLLGKTTEKKMRYRDDDFYVKNNCRLILGMKVTAINAEKKIIKLEDNSVIAYDKLLVGTGSSAFMPPIRGLEMVRNKFAFMSLDDAKDLRNVINRTSRVLIVGAGLIGLKCAEGIIESVSEVTVVDLAKDILSSILDSDGSNLIQKHLESKGIIFKLSHSISSINNQQALLENGEVVEFDVVVLATGVQPNTELLRNIAEIGKGIKINTKMETTHTDIYAAGDCTQSIDISSGEDKIMALLPNAYMQGECAGINMAGGVCHFDKALPLNSIGFFGIHMITAGSYAGDVYFEFDGSNYKKLFYSENKLNGYILIGNVEKAGIYTSLIRERTALDTLDFAMICKRPGLMAFAKSDRSITLGGEAK